MSTEGAQSKLQLCFRPERRRWASALVIPVASGTSFEIPAAKWETENQPDATGLQWIIDETLYV